MKSLLKARIRQLKNISKETTLSKFFLFALLGFSFFGIMIFIFFKVFGFLYHQQEFPLYFKLFLCEKVLMMTFLTMFLMLVLSSLISTLNIFFLSKDLHLLLSSPLPSRKVFIWKAIEVALSSSVMVVFFSFPALFAYSYYFAPHPVDIIGILSIFLLYIICGVSLGIITGLIIPAFISVRKLQPVLSVVSIIFISGIVIFLRLLRPERFGNPGAINNLVDYMGSLNVKGSGWFPFYWIARGLHMLAKTDYREFIKEIAVFLGVVIALCAFILFLQKRFYLPLFDKLNKGSAGSYRSSWKKPTFLSQDYSALWKKEVKTFVRNPSQWSQLLVIGAIVIVFILNIKGIPMPHPSVKNLIAYLNLVMAAFIVSGLNSRFTFLALPMENPGLIHVMASPFSMRKVFKFKLLFYVIPQIIIGFTLFLAGDAALGLDTFARFSGFVFLAPVLPFLTILALYFSLKVDESVPLTPQHLILSRSGISYMLWSMFYTALGMVYLVRPLFLYYYTKWTKLPVPVLEISIWFGVFIPANIALFALFYKKCSSIWNNKEISSPML
jgi:ABC-2 type transport system permease protein